MPRSFDMSADCSGSVESVHRAFSEADYWLARLAISPVDVATLESIRVDRESGNEGCIEVITLQSMLNQNLPALVTQLHRGDLCVRREERWGPVVDGTATAAITGSIVDAPVSVSGSAVLAPITDSGGARLTYRVSIHVRVPIIGGKIEKIIGTQLVGLIDAEQRFTTTWVTNNA
jgi:Protein of unknown function (DUF2505)